jgi:hypothetical protein
MARKQTKTQSANVKNRSRSRRVSPKSASKDKAASIGAAGRKSSKSRGKTSRFEGMNREDLYSKARKAGIRGRSKMSKDQLIDALRTS